MRWSRSDSVIINGLELNTRDADGVEWDLDAVTGFGDAPNVYSSDQRAQADGIWISPVLKGPKTVGISGSINAATPELLEVALNRLRVAVGGRTLFPVTFGWSTGPLTCWVIRDSPLEPSRPQEGRIEYDLTFTAPDPTLYQSGQGGIGVTATTGLPVSTGGLTFGTTIPESVHRTNLIPNPQPTSTAVIAGTPYGWSRLGPGTGALQPAPWNAARQAVVSQPVTVGSTSTGYVYSQSTGAVPAGAMVNYRGKIAWAGLGTTQNYTLSFRLMDRTSGSVYLQTLIVKDSAVKTDSGYAEMSGSFTLATASTALSIVALMSIGAGGATTTERMYLGDVQIEIATSGAYFDGAAPGSGDQTHRWNGAINASTSDEFTPAIPGAGITFPVIIGGVSVSGDITVNNPGTSGKINFRIQGPVTNPRVLVRNADGLQTLAWRLTLAADEYLDVDPQARTAMLQGQSSRPPYLRQWPRMTAGVNIFSFRGDTFDPAAQLAVTYLTAT